MTILFVAALVVSAPELKRVEVMVDGVAREALVSVPDKASKETPAPVVFAFHGHGGTMQNAARTFHIEREWPEAVVIYMQGLKTATPRDPEGLKPGWQNRVGMLGDRDFKAFDAFLDLVRSRTTIDEDRIYAMGHSNGGGFTYALWAARPKVFAAIAPSSANPPVNDSRPPLPTFHVTGKTDAIVSYEGQVRTINAVKRVNGCADDATDWAAGCRQFPSSKGAPVVWMVHEGGHKYHAEAPALIVRFFKEHRRKPELQPAAP